MRSIDDRLDTETDFARGFDHGNYGNAYESQDWEAWYDAQDLTDASVAFQEGMILGFFSSYDLDEIFDEIAREDVRVLRAKHGE
jgi:hypothetical protein